MPTFEVNSQSEVARLVQFSTGKLNPEVKDQLEFKCYRDKHGLNRDKKNMVISTQVKDIKFSGQNYGVANHFSRDSCDYYVAVQRKGSDKVQILPAELFQLQPKFEDPLEGSSSDQANLSYKEKRISLIQQFGSGQLQRKINKHLKANLDEKMVSSTTESVAAKVMKDKIAANETEDASTSKDNASSGTASSLVPPHNRDATDPADVYPMETIIPAWVMEALEQQGEVFVSATQENIDEWRQKKEYFETVLTLLEKLPSDENERRLPCAHIMFLNCLLHAYNMNSHMFRKRKDKYPVAWQGPVKKLLDDHCVVEIVDKSGKKSLSRPSQKKDLTLSLILVLYMRLCNYRIPLKSIVTDLKMTMKRVSLHAQMLGCKVKSEKGGHLGDSTFATLTTPLRFPQPMKKAVGKIR